MTFLDVAKKRQMYFLLFKLNIYLWLPLKNLFRKYFAPVTRIISIACLIYLAYGGYTLVMRAGTLQGEAAGIAKGMEAEFYWSQIHGYSIPNAVKQTLKVSQIDDFIEDLSCEYNVLEYERRKENFIISPHQPGGHQIIEE